MDVARAVVRKRAWVFAAWLLAGAALLPAARHADTALDVSARILGSQSADVEKTLAERFASPFAHTALLVVSGVPSPDMPAGREALKRVTSALALPGVTRTFSYLDRRDPYFLGSGGSGTFVVVGLDPVSGRVDSLIPGLRAATEACATRLRANFPGAALRWTGEAALNFDLWRTSTDAVHASERRTLPITILLLLAAFGAVGAALIPMLAGILSVALTLGAVALVSSVWPLSILIENVVSMLGLALGIDYSLLTVSRFREGVAAGASVEEAAAAAARHAGGTVALSGAPVAIGFLALLLVPLNELRSAGIGGLLVVSTSVLLAVTLVPALLATFGARIDAGRLWPRRQAAPASDGWRRWAGRIVAHPWLVLVLALPPVLLLAAQAHRLNPRIPRSEWLPRHMESARAVDDLRAMDRSGMVQSLRVILELPEDTSALSREGWEATRRCAETLARDPRVAHVRSLRDLVDEQGGDLAAVSLLPAVAKRTFLSEEGDAALLEVIPREQADPDELSRFVRELRRSGAGTCAGLPGSRLEVGGLPAFHADYEDAVATRLRDVVALVVAGTLVALLFGFRSILVPLKALALNLLAVAAAFGATVLVFQDGHGVRLLGLSGPVDGVFPIVPALVFCTVFGLSMDYEVFLVARVAEARRRGMSESEALVEGFARTGGVITSAAMVMIAVFASFTLGEFVLVKMLGFALATAVLLDATIIRMAVGPALLRLAGRWNWWPGGAAEPSASPERAERYRLKRETRPR